jgi:uncharacterized membrane protein YgdD (TMEM256/DUF423 family)
VRSLYRLPDQSGLRKVRVQRGQRLDTGDEFGGPRDDPIDALVGETSGSQTLADTAGKLWVTHGAILPEYCAILYCAMDRIFFALGSLLAFFSVALGAFGAHSLQGSFAPGMADIYETGVRYQFYHAIGLLAVALAADRWPGSSALVAGWLFIAGVILFSGSLYLLSVTGLRWLGAVTPFGGVAFLAGWLVLGWSVLRAPG